mmetsp:Transcript_10830/g.20381  ORF Transcript_10830/g.20381 Transcript_10830/m.20381 type:complete len:238 (-) Transcript_10830:506-1219(-)
MLRKVPTCAIKSVRLLPLYLRQYQVVVECVLHQLLHGLGERLPLVREEEDVVRHDADGVNLRGDDVHADVLEDAHDVHQQAAAVGGHYVQPRARPARVLPYLDGGGDGRLLARLQRTALLLLARPAAGGQVAARLRVKLHHRVENHALDLLQPLRGGHLLARLGVGDVEAVGLLLARGECRLGDVQPEPPQRAHRVQQVTQQVAEFNHHHRCQRVCEVVNDHRRCNLGLRNAVDFSS